MGKPLNRAGRRAGMRSRQPDGAFWSGRCWCEACKGKTFPDIYCLRVFPHRRKDSRKKRKALIRRGETVPTTISYECFTESLFAGTEPGGTSSSSAQGLGWLADRFAAGVKTEIGEAPLAREGEGSLEAEIDRHASLMRHLLAIHGTSKEGLAEVRRGEKRYLELCRQFGTEDMRLRLYQWLANEFKGWQNPDMPTT